MLSLKNMLWSRRLYFFSAVCLLVVFLLIAIMTGNSVRSRSKFRLSVLRTTSTVFRTINSEGLEVVISDIKRTTLNSTPKIEVRTLKRKRISTSKFKKRGKSFTFRKALSSTSSPTVLSVNHDTKRSSCGIRLSKASMCPPLYAEIGGKCMYNNTRVICNDVRRLSDYRIRQAQLVITRLLNAFNVVARKHGVKYWLSSGTLLGAVRHKGFIPWDDDGDIEMTLDEYEKFYRNASKDLPDDVFFQNSESDPYLRPSNPEEYKSETYKDIGLYKRTYNPRLRDRKSCYRYCIDYGCKWHDGAMVDIFVVESVPEAYYPLQQVEFEGLNFPVQNNWKEELTSKYGEGYMEIPKTISFEAYYPDAEHGCEQLQK